MGATKNRMLAVAVVAAVPLGLAGPVEAATYSNGCTVTPAAPKVVGTHSSGLPLISYEIDVSCHAGRKIEVKQEVWEQDNGKPGDYGGDDFVSRWNSGGKKTYTQKTLRVYRAHANRDTDDWSEYYQRVQFRVTSESPGRDVVGPWTTWEKGPLRDIFY